MPLKYSSNPKFESLTHLKVNIILGGSSSERDISLRSGNAVYDALKRVGIHCALVDPSRVAGNQTYQCDLAFIALHGSGGEDGVIQKTLERLKITYTGSDPDASAKAFHKGRAKELFRQYGIPTAEYKILKRNNWKQVLNGFPAPFFVKPVANGSSVGIYCVDDMTKAVEKIDQSIKEHKEVMVERRIIGREFTVGVLGNEALPVIELKPKRPFYDYEAKYTAGMTEYLVPAPIDELLESSLKRIAIEVHEKLGLRDLSRTDFMTDTSGNIFVLEINSIPGLTELSLLPKAARAAGISFEEMCLRILSAAFDRSEMKQKGVSGNGEKAEKVSV